MYASVALGWRDLCLASNDCCQGLYIAWQPQLCFAGAAHQPLCLFFGNLATTVLALLRAFHIALRRSTRTHGNRPWHSFEYIDVS